MHIRLILLTILTLIVTLQPTWAAPVPQDPGGEAYTVQADDWLSKIADKFYGEALAYPAIVAATNAKAAEDSSFTPIDNPDLIEIGQTLWIPAEIAGQPLTVEMLQNARYEGIYEDSAAIQLSNGSYEGEPFVPGGASRPTVTMIAEVVGFGDLNGNGGEDAAVILVENSGGSGSFYYLAVVLNQNGVPHNAATIFIGDRAQIKGITLSDDTITLQALTHGPDDGLCCPTVETTLTHRLENGQLVETTQDVAGIYKGFFIAASSPGRDSTFYLNADKTAQLTTDFLNDEPPIVEVGSWAVNEAGQIEVTLTGQADRPYEEPVVELLTWQEGILTEADTQPGQIIQSWIEISALATGQHPVPYNPADLDQMIQDRGFIGIYKTYLPAASCCGRDVTLLLGINQMAQFKTDFLNGEPPLIEIGQWQMTEDNQVSLTLTGRPEQAPYATPTQITFAWVDNKLTAVEYDQNLFGSEGLSLYHSAGLLASIERP